MVRGADPARIAQDHLAAYRHPDTPHDSSRVVHDAHLPPAFLTPPAGCRARFCPKMHDFFGSCKQVFDKLNIVRVYKSDSRHGFVIRHPEFVISILADNLNI
jgi:hypothetical protein